MFTPCSIESVRLFSVSQHIVKRFSLTMSVDSVDRDYLEGEEVDVVYDEYELQSTQTRLPRQVLYIPLVRYCISLSSGTVYLPRQILYIPLIRYYTSSGACQQIWKSSRHP